VRTVDAALTFRGEGKGGRRGVLGMRRKKKKVKRGRKGTPTEERISIILSERETGIIICAV